MEPRSAGALAYLRLPTFRTEDNMVCYRVRIPGHTKVAGATADGQVTTVLPGEYLVNVLQPKIATAQPLVRFVGADPACRDVHVPLDVAKRYLAMSSNDCGSFEVASAA